MSQGPAEPAFDLQRLHELRSLVDFELPTLVATLLAELDRATAALATGVAAGAWESASQAAHAARNSALMVDARPLLAALDEVEQATRRADRRRAEAAAARVQRLWPELRRELEAVASASS